MDARFSAQTDRSFAIIVAVILGLWVMAFHAAMVPLGEVSHNDEFHTLDRTTAFARQGDWLNVYTSQEVNFNKPPLQYWMSAALLEFGVDLTIAVRAPSWLFAGLCLAATGLLAAALLPGNPWVIPAAILLVSSSQRFWESGISALLDMGALLFVTLALAATLLALRRPGWWYVAAVAVGVGSLQKAPIPLALVFLFLLFLGLTARWHGFRFRTFLTNKHFLLSTLIALALTASWHGWQFAQHGSVALSSGIGEQMLSRLAPSAESVASISLRDAVDHMIGSEGLIRVLGLLAIFALPFQLKRYELLPLPMIVLVYMAAVTFGSGYIAHRYTLLLATLVAASLAALLFHLSVSTKAKALSLALISLLNGGPVKSPMELPLFANEKDKSQQVTLAALAQADETASAYVYCNWERAWWTPPALLSFASPLDRPYYDLRSPERFRDLVDKGAIKGQILGVCPQDQLEEIRDLLADLEIRETAAVYVYYSARVAP